MDVNDQLTTYGSDGSDVRINPVVTMDNGMTYTAWNLASYKVINPDVGQVDKAGKVNFLKSKALQVEVSYMGLTVSHTIDYDRLSG